MRWIIVPVGYQFGLVGGPEKREIRLVPYQGGWPDRFRLERAQIVRALGAAARRVDHIGSPPVPRLAANPILDTDLSVADADAEASDKIFQPFFTTKPAGQGTGAPVGAHRRLVSMYTSAQPAAPGNDDTCCSATGCAMIRWTGIGISGSNRT